MPSELTIRICPSLVNRSACTVPYHTHAHMQHTNDKKQNIHRQLMSKILHHFWATPCKPAFNIGGCWRQRPARTTKKTKTPRALIAINVKYGGCRGELERWCGILLINRWATNPSEQNGWVFCWKKPASHGCTRTRAHCRKCCARMYAHCRTVVCVECMSW